MATITQRGTTVDITGSAATWTNTSNAVDAGTATYATWTSATSSANGLINISGYDFSSIPAGSTIDSVSVSMRHVESSTTDIWLLRCTIANGTTSIGEGSWECTRATSARTDTNSANWAGVTLDQLQAANFRSRVFPSHEANTTSATFQIDWCDVTVNYTPQTTVVTQTQAATWDVAMVHARPSADTATAGWSDESGATTNLFQKINETPADDADYVKATR